MEPPVEENVVKKDKPITARILSSAVCILTIFFRELNFDKNFFQDLKDMMSGSSKGLPIKVPTIPIKVMTSNASQVRF